MRKTVHLIVKLEQYEVKKYLIKQMDFTMNELFRKFYHRLDPAHFKAPIKKCSKIDSLKFYSSVL